MWVINQLLRLMTFLIYSFLAMIVLSFPLSELLTRIGRETRLFHFSLKPAVEDSLLPGLGLALLCALLMAIRRKFDSIQGAGTNAGSPEDP